MAERRLLLVDDDKTIHSVFRAALAKHGFQVHSAYDSVQATGVARQVKPDVIVLDLSMPGGGGFEAFRRFQMLTTTAQIPVLIYSSLPPAQVLERIPESTTVAHLLKPAPPEQILAAILKLVGEGEG